MPGQKITGIRLYNSTIRKLWASLWDYYEADTPYHVKKATTNICN